MLHSRSTDFVYGTAQQLSGYKQAVVARTRTASRRQFIETLPHECELPNTPGRDSGY